ncbi:MAG: FAD:protein FMN transferase [Proteobacteria bacterium]|nr:FAD:protein FMN transferase [Pseudomonadota bacterium]
MRAYSACALLLTVAISGCAASSGGTPAAYSAEAARGWPVMGTVLELRVTAADKATAADLADRAEQLVAHWDDVLTTWSNDGQLYRFNQRAGDGPQLIGHDLAMALASMLRLSRDTDGAFDPAVGPLVNYWREQPGLAVPPTAGPEARIASTLKLNGDRASLLADSALDAGGIGKGLALDAAVDLLLSLGARGAWLNLGGSSQAAFGSDSRGRPWRVAVAALDTTTVHGSVLLDGRSLSTSRSRPVGDPAGCVIDPSSQRPVTEPRIATVLAADGATAEAWSTALVVLGRMGVQAARDAGVEVVFEDPAGVVITQGFPLERQRAESQDSAAPLGH